MLSIGLASAWAGMDGRQSRARPAVVSAAAATSTNAAFQPRNWPTQVASGTPRMLAVGRYRGTVFPHSWCRPRPQPPCKRLTGLKIAETSFPRRVHHGGESTRTRKRLPAQWLTVLADLLSAPRMRKDPGTAPSTVSSSGMTDHGAVAFLQRPERFGGGDRCQHLVVVPRLGRLRWRLHLEQVHVVKLAAIGADRTLAE